MSLFSAWNGAGISAVLTGAARSMVTRYPVDLDADDEPLCYSRANSGNPTIDRNRAAMLFSPPEFGEVRQNRATWASVTLGPIDEPVEMPFLRRNRSELVETHTETSNGVR